MRRTFFIILLCLPLLSNSQESKFSNIINNETLLVGIGEHRDFDRADQIALKDLISQISVSVEGSFKTIVQESNNDLREFTESVIESYSSSILTNAERKIETLQDGTYRVYRYIAKKDKNRIFNDRKAKIQSYCTQGLRAEDVNDTDIALRDYYWALVLLRSHPDRGQIYHEIKGEQILLSVWLPQHIQQLLTDIRLIPTNTTAGQENAAIYITASNSSGAITNLGLKYFDGAEFIEASVKDGRGVLYIPETYRKSASKIDAMIDYQFLHLLGDFPLDKEVKSVIKNVFVPFNNHTDVLLKQNKEKVFMPEIEKITDSSDQYLSELTQSVIDAIQTRDLESIRDLFTEQGYEQFSKIMHYGNVQLYEGEHPVHFVRFGERTLIRTIPLVFELTDRNRRVIYDSICPIVEDGKIAWVNFAINDRDAEDAIRRGEIKNDLQERLVSLTFMEYYKTVFMLKDIDRIGEIFRDDAVIFVGYVKGTTKSQTNLADQVQHSISLHGHDVEMVEYDKQTYLDRLEKAVFINPFVNIQFSDMMIERRSEKSPIFAIQLHQDYYSTNYADDGYLLLYTDNSDSSAPKIFFRCWQPEKFVDISDIRIE